MPLNSILLKSDIKAIFKNAFDSSANTDPDAAIDLVAQQLADRIVEEIQKLTLTIPSGLVIVATGTGPASNPAPIIINNGVA